MALPRFSYNPGTGVVNLDLKASPKIAVPLHPVAVRHDNYSTAGVRETVTERTNQIVAMEFLAISVDDLADWANFLDFALVGSTFSYYPDSSLSTHTDYTLQDSEWVPTLKAPGICGFTLKFLAA
jgi:hypothetical protein